MEFLSPTYSARYTRLHGEWYGVHKSPVNPTARERYLKHRELGWDSSVRKYTPPSIKGIKPVTLEPWADETLTVDDSWDRIGGDKNDVQGGLLRGMLSYQTDTTSRRYLKTVLRHEDPELYATSLK